MGILLSPWRHNILAMHPVEAASILSQLAYIPPSTATTFADAYAKSYGHASIPVFAPVKPYTPQFSDFTYASKYRFEPNTAAGYYSSTGTQPHYDPDCVGRGSAYERNLFLMTRDAAVLDVLAKTNPRKNFYCVRNGDPVESPVHLREFKEGYTGLVVYPCTGSNHDKHVPKCVCPVSQVDSLRAKIQAHRKAAPFATQLADLHSKVGDAHSIAHNLEYAAFPSGTLLANYSFETWGDLGVDQAEWPDRSLNEFKMWTNTRESPDINTVKNARSVAEAATIDLEVFIKENEDAAFAAFKPHVRTIFARGRTNTIDGYSVQNYPLSVDDINDELADPGSGNSGVWFDR